MFIVVHGRVDVFNHADVLQLSFKRGALFGEFAALGLLNRRAYRAACYGLGVVAVVAVAAVVVVVVPPLLPRGLLLLPSRRAQLRPSEPIEVPIELRPFEPTTDGTR